MTKPAAVGELVERLDSHRDAYRSGRYNETQLRRDSLDPLFEAIRRGAIDRIVCGKRVKNGTAEVDSAFFDEIESRSGRGS